MTTVFVVLNEGTVHKVFSSWDGCLAEMREQDEQGNYMTYRVMLVE